MAVAVVDIFYESRSPRKSRDFETMTKIAGFQLQVRSCAGSIVASMNTVRIGSGMARRDAKKRIALVVDDDANFRECVRMMLRVGGFTETLGAGDVNEAVALTQNRRIDLIVSDWNMQPRDGLDFLRAVRGNPLTRDIPFILVTASLSEDAWRGAIEFGASDFLLKPFTIGQLHESAHLCLALEERRRAWSNVIEFRRKRAGHRRSG